MKISRSISCVVQSLLKKHIQASRSRRHIRMARSSEQAETRCLLAATFSTSSISLQTSGSYGVVATDLNGDSNPDFAVSNTSGFINVSLGNGLGGFGSTAFYSTGLSGHHDFSLAHGQISGSSLPELVVGSYGSSGVRVMSNNGGGSFSQSSFFNAGGPIIGVAVGDLNGDGTNDIVAARYEQSSVAVFYLNSSGGLITSSFWSTGSQPREVIVADLDGDGRRDIVSANSGNNTLTVLRNLGGGPAANFATSTVSSGGSLPAAVHAADFSGDGLLDLVTQNVNSSNLSYLRNTGGANFTLQQTVSALGWGITSLDFDRDGRQDIAVANLNGNSIRVLRNINGTSFSFDSQHSVPSPFEIVAADFNKDGRLDLAHSSTNHSFVNVLSGTTNSSPSDITLSNSTVNENLAANTTVGNLSATDPNTTDTQTFSLVSGTGSADNAKFSIIGNSLRTAQSFNFETQSTFSIRVRTADAYGGSFEEVLTVLVTDVNESPTNISLSNDSVSENLPSGTAVGNLSTTDPDSGNTFTYSLVIGSGDSDNASFSIDGGTLKTVAPFDFETKSNYSIRVRTTDQGGLPFEKVLAISVNNVNETPTDISLTNSTLAENAGVNAVIGDLSATDQDPIEDFTLSLPVGVDDNAAFSINGTSLQANASFDFETKSSYVVTVRATDSGNLTFDKQFTITLTNVNETPTDISLSNSTIAENAGVNALVGSLSGTDPDSGDVLSFSLPVGVDDNAAFSINGTSLQANASFDFETKSSYVVTVRATDSGNLTFDKQFTIIVTNVNETPTDISLSNSSVAENLAAGTSVGNFSTTDPDSGNTFTYTLVAGTGSTDNGSFAISGSTLQTAAVFNFETKSSYSIRVLSTDQGGLSVEKVFTISVQNVTEMGGIDVQLGQTQRSYVRYLDVVFDRPDDIMDMINNNRFLLTKRDLNGLNPVNVPLTPSMFSRVGNSGRLNFGANGLGGNRNSNVGDGYYEIAVDTDANGTFESSKSFYRLLGDINGDRRVDSSDSNLVTSAFGTSNPERDANGDGVVNANDRTLVLRALGRKLKDDLFADD